MQDQRDEERIKRALGPVVTRASETLSDLLARPLAPGLYLVATPIGNLGDISLRALSILARADLIAAEDTRHSKKLLSHFGVSGALSAYHEHNAERERPRLLARLRAGQSVALISDAGTPLISDPGYKLVHEALAAGLAVISIPGPSASLAALTSSGLPTDTFLFAGFLPPKSGCAQRAAPRTQGRAGDAHLFRDGLAPHQEPCRHGGCAGPARGGHRQRADQAA